MGFDAPPGRAASSRGEGMARCGFTDDLPRKTPDTEATRAKSFRSARQFRPIREHTEYPLVLDVIILIVMGYKILILALGLIVGASWPFVIAFARGSSSESQVAGLKWSGEAPSYDFVRSETGLLTSGADDADMDVQAAHFKPGGIAPAVVRVLTESTSGSGVIVDPDGVVLTSGHLVGGSNKVTVIVGDREQLVGDVTRLDIVKDLALVRLPKGEYDSVALGAEADIVLGAPIYSIGYPLDMAGPASITTGVVSRYFDGSASRGKIIQTDAAINEGNSGGPIVDEKGRIIGIVVSVAGEGTTGISFAVSVATIKKHFLD